MEATPTLIQGGTPNLLEGSLVPPHARKRRPSKTRGQHEQEGGDDGNAMKRSRFMRMAGKLRNKGLEVTCPAEF